MENFAVFADKTAVSQNAGNWAIGSLGGMNVAPTYIASEGVTVIQRSAVQHI